MQDKKLINIWENIFVGFVVISIIIRLCSHSFYDKIEDIRFLLYLIWGVGGMAIVFRYRLKWYKGITVISALAVILSVLYFLC